MLLLTLATGTIERFPQGDTGFDDLQLPLPAWRTPGEFVHPKKRGVPERAGRATRELGGCPERQLAQRNAATSLSLADVHEAALNSAWEMSHRAREKFHAPVL